MLSEYTGPSNNKDIFRYLVGEKIRAVFMASEPRASSNNSYLWIVVESGEAFVLCSTGGGTPSFWKNDASKVEEVVRARRAEIQLKLDELGDMAGINLESADEKEVADALL